VEPAAHSGLILLFTRPPTPKCNAKKFIELIV